MAASAVVLLLTATSARAAEKQPGGDSVTPAIEKFVSSFESAFNRGDAKSLAALWTPGGDLVGVQGKRTEGRQQIEKQFEGLFSANKNMKLKMSIVAVHPVGDSAAVVDIGRDQSALARDPGGAAIDDGPLASRRPLAHRDRPGHPRL